MMAAGIEKRVLPASVIPPAVEDRAADAGPVFVGLAPPWDSWSADLGFRERFIRGAFRDVLADPALDCVANWQHDDSFPLGRTTNGTLELVEAERGLAWRALPIWPSARVADYAAQVRGAYVFGSSFAFAVLPDPTHEVWGMDGEEITRTILRVFGLYDVAIVTHAAYPDSSIGLRRRDRWAAENLTAAEVARVHQRDADRHADRRRAEGVGKTLAPGAAPGTVPVSVNHGARARAVAAVARMRFHAGGLGR